MTAEDANFDTIEVAEGGGSKTEEPPLPEFYPPSSSGEEEEIYSNQSVEMDYTSWKGIESRTGIEKENAYGFVIKELFDNATDFLEVQATNPQIYIIIERREPSFFSIKVANSNYNNKPAFSKQMLGSIFNVGTYYSSKRNQFKISRGAQGDASKLLLCIPYALAREGGVTGWNEPLTIRNNTGEIFEIRLTVNRINGRFHTDIQEIENRSSSLTNHNTEVEIHMPILHDITPSFGELLDHIRHYAMFNTHIEFIFQSYDGCGLRLRPTQPIIKNWKNRSFIRSYTLSEFHDFILGLENNDLKVHDVLLKTFREATNMKTSRLTEMTVGKLKHSDQDIRELYIQLRDSMEPGSSLSLPFDVTSKKARAAALKKRIEQIFPYSLDMKYKSAVGTYYSDDGVIQFPFFFEIAIVHSKYFKHNNLAISQALNCSMAPNSRIVFGGEKFNWTTQNSKYTYKSYDIRDILTHFGYSQNKNRCKKPNNLIIANLISPRIDYKSYGKSHLF